MDKSQGLIVVQRAVGLISIGNNEGVAIMPMVVAVARALRGVCCADGRRRRLDLPYLDGALRAQTLGLWSSALAEGRPQRRADRGRAFAKGT